MAWIKSHQEIAQHPKTRRLARLLGEGLPCVIGRLHLLWWWALDYAEDGDLSRYEEADIADACQWDGDPEQLVEALVSVRFLDRADDQLVIHDWGDYAGRLIEKRQSEVQRVQRWRQAQKSVALEPETPSPEVANGPVTRNVRDGYVPRVDKSREDKTRDEDHAATAAAPVRSVPKKAKGPDLGPLVDAFRALGLPDPSFTGGEGRAAQLLLATHSPEVVAACWQDIATGQYGDDFSKRDLSFGFLSSRQRVANWQRWKSQPAGATPHSRPRGLHSGSGGKQGFSTAELVYQQRQRGENIPDSELWPEDLAELEAIYARERMTQ